MAEAGKLQEFTFEEKVGWSTLMIQKGQVIEIYIPKSNLTIQVEEWCSFVVLNVNTQTDGSMVAEVRFMGCTDGEVSKLLEEEMNGRGKKGRSLHYPYPSGSGLELRGLHRCSVCRLQASDASSSVVEERSKWRRRRRSAWRRGRASGWIETTCGQEIGETQGRNQSKASEGARRGPWRRGEETFSVDERQTPRSTERGKRKGSFFQAQRWDGFGVSFGRAGSNHPSIRGFRFRLCSGREAEYRFESGSTTPCAGRSRCRRGEEGYQARQRKGQGGGTEEEKEETETSRGAIRRRVEDGGFKRYYFRKFEDAASQEGSPERKDDVEGEEEASGQERCSQETPRGADRCLEPEGVEKEEGERKEEEEEKEISGWSDRELQLNLQFFLSGGGGGSLLHQRRFRNPNEETVSGQTRFGPQDVDSARSGAVRTSCHYRAGDRSELADRRSEDSNLLCPPDPSFVSELIERDERDASSFTRDGCFETRRESEGGGCPGGSLYGDSPVAPRPELGHGEVHGDLSLRGSKRRFEQYGPGHQETYQDGGQDAGLYRRRKLVWTTAQRWERWQRTMVQLRRSEGQRQRLQRKGKEGQRPRKRKERLVGGSQRVEGHEGQARREVREDSRFTRGLATALPSAVPAESAAVDFQTIASRSTDLRELGCALAWWISACSGRSAEFLNSRLVASVFSSDVWHRAVALPLREGELSEICLVMRRTTLDDIFAEAFLCEWSHNAWVLVACYAVNNLYGVARPLERGGWSKAEKRAVKAIGEGVTRLLRHGTVKVPMDPNLEKELRNKRINYQGEEVGICHKLTMEQVLPSLPPVGSMVDPSIFASLFQFKVHTRMMLLNPGKCILGDVGQKLPKLQLRACSC